MPLSSRKTLVNLLKGWPHNDLTPLAAVRAATQTALSDPHTSVLALRYGPDEGYPPLREEIARWLSAFYSPANPTSSARICISGGASQNLARVLQGFTDPIYTRNIWMIAPTYFLASRILEDGGFLGKLRAVPEDDEGIDMAILRSKIRDSEEDAIAGGNLKPVRQPHNH